MAAIKFNNINFKYPNNNENTIDNFSFKIEKGEIVAILGESGSGKSTFLRILCGFETPSTGSIKIGEKNIFCTEARQNILTEKRNIGMVFQDYALFPHLTVEKNIKFGLPKKNKNKHTSIVDNLLDMVQLSEHKKKYPHELSGGQQQRIALARALAPNPELLLLDEPFSNLDTNLQNNIREDLKNIIKSAGTTTIFVSHNKEDALKIADKAIILEKGKIVQHGAPHEIYSNPINTYVENLFCN